MNNPTTRHHPRSLAAGAFRPVAQSDLDVLARVCPRLVDHCLPLEAIPDLQTVALAFVLSRSPAEVADAAAGGAESFDAAVSAFFAQMSADEIQARLKALCAHLQAQACARHAVN